MEISKQSKSIWNPPHKDPHPVGHLYDRGTNFNIAEFDKIKNIGKNYGFTLFSYWKGAVYMSKLNESNSELPFQICVSISKMLDQREGFPFQFSLFGVDQESLSQWHSGKEYFETPLRLLKNNIQDDFYTKLNSTSLITCPPDHLENHLNYYLNGWEKPISCKETREGQRALF